MERVKRSVKIRTLKEGEFYNGELTPKHQDNVFEVEFHDTGEATFKLSPLDSYLDADLYIYSKMRVESVLEDGYKKISLGRKLGSSYCSGSQMEKEIIDVEAGKKYYILVREQVRSGKVGRYNLIAQCND